MSPAQATKRFHDLVWPHRATVLRVAHVLTGNAAEAEDLAQETLLKAYRGIDGFSAGDDAGAWLLTILRRARIDRSRSPASRAGMASLEQMEMDPVEPDHVEVGDHESVWANPESVLQGFSDQQVIDALQTLPEEIRLTLLLADVEGLVHPDVATILGVPVGTIKSRVHRGRAMLRQALLPIARDLRIVHE